MSPNAQPAYRERARVALIAGCCFRHDAISAAAFDTFDALVGSDEFHVTLITSHNEYPERQATIARSASDLLLNAEFRRADIILYHFGIYHPLFDVMPVGNGRARQAAFFHNITPARFLPDSAAPTIAASFRQLNCLRHVDEIWPVSRTNLETLAELAFDTARMSIVPLAVGTPAIPEARSKHTDRIELLFLGRIVRSKGITDLVEAVAALPRHRLPPIRLTITGNLAHSDADCVSEVQSLIKGRDLEGCVRFAGTVDDASRDRLLLDSHILAIPSYHEGFCKPVIEGLRAGCIPVGYAAYNLRHIADGLGRMVDVGDIAALSDALKLLIQDIHSASHDPEHPIHLDRGPLNLAAFQVAATQHAAQFAPTRIAELTRARVRALLAAPRSTAGPFARLRAATAPGRRIRTW